MNLEKSQELYAKAKQLMPAGVNSPVRAFKSVGGTPVFIDHARSSKIYDVDGNEYIDYVLSWGPMILGHAHPEVVEALKMAAELGTSFGAPTQRESQLAEMIIKAYPSMECLRLVNSGTEAAMSAIRVARGYTCREFIVKFEGCYHGHGDGLLVKAGSGAATFGVPDSLGVPKGYAEKTITLPYNDINAFRALMNSHGNEIACVILEPVAGNMGCVLPRDGFLQEIRELTEAYRIVLIFDEVMTGFRVAYGGGQVLFNINPDMTCLGKVMGGGLPAAAYGGKEAIMKMVAPDGPVYQAGTLSGNPLAVTAGIKTIEILSKDGIYKELEQKGIALEEGLVDAARKAGVKIKLYRVGSMFCTYFTDQEVVDFQSAKTSDVKMFTKFFHNMLQKGVYLAPSQFEAGFLSLAHSQDDIEKTVKAAYESMKECQ